MKEFQAEPKPDEIPPDAYELFYNTVSYKQGLKTLQKELEKGELVTIPLPPTLPLPSSRAAAPWVKGGHFSQYCTAKT